MPNFSKTSINRLVTCHKDLRIIFMYVIKYFDCSILCGYRGKKSQETAFQNGYSTLHFPESKHNKKPSLAVDAVPYPINWQNINRMRLFAGFVLGVAEVLRRKKCIKSRIRWGGDWDKDTFVNDQRFNDYPHFEII